MNIDIEILNDNVKYFTYATEGSSGFDLVADNFKKLTSNSTGQLTDVHSSHDYIFINPNQRALVGCGFKIAIPKGFEMQIRPRSGLALKHGLTVLNAPGTIDSDYRGEVGVILINTGSDPVKISKHDKIAQGVIQAIEKATFNLVDKLDDTARGEGGFGSTGVSDDRIRDVLKGSIDQSINNQNY